MKEKKIDSSPSNGSQSIVRSRSSSSPLTPATTASTVTSDRSSSTGTGTTVLVGDSEEVPRRRHRPVHQQPSTKYQGLRDTMRCLARNLRLLISMPSLYDLFFLILLTRIPSISTDLWPMERPDGMPVIQNLEVMCGKDHMDVHLTFTQPFEGIVSSKGQHGDPRCVYVPPSSGQTFFSFRIAYARCGTKPDLHGQYYENTVVVQYDKDLLEVWDEAKRLRCEWFNDYEKTASKPPMVIADLDVIQLDFRGDNVDCWMEIQHGKGPWAPPVSGIVPLGSTLTLVVAINDYRGEFDMRVKSCVASDGGGHVIRLSDESGCVLRPKMISRFLKARGADERASVITYAFFHAFKFPDALSVHIKCKVEICRHGCLDHCQNTDLPDADGDAGYYVNHLERKDDDVLSGEEKIRDPPGDVDDVLYEEVVRHRDGGGDAKLPGAGVKVSLDGKVAHGGPQDLDGDSDETDLELAGLTHKEIYSLPLQEKFPHGPRRIDEPPVAGPRSLDDENRSSAAEESLKSFEKRRKRSVIVSDRKARSADVGVSSLYEVISEADLAFSPDGRTEEAVTVFQGRIREEVVYGICMPVPGFSVLFVLAAASAVASALVAGSLLYRYQLQKERLAEEARCSRNGAVPAAAFSNWMGLGLLRGRCGGGGAVASRRAAKRNGEIDGVATTAMGNGKAT
ncbi:unnamed protein product [Phyllotreta striolata]|uniref:ZP domain-containing protein n=1 Tax=Phyllotreta striolata TaxID=444603 RepID=A0A9N9U033_PHYSR|nr:unnamed protein product [Phyllotreta striolata]